MADADAEMEAELEAGVCPTAEEPDDGTPGAPG